MHGAAHRLIYSGNILINNMKEAGRKIRLNKSVKKSQIMVKLTVKIAFMQQITMISVQRLYE